MIIEKRKDSNITEVNGDGNLILVKKGYIIEGRNIEHYHFKNVKGVIFEGIDWKRKIKYTWFVIKYIWSDNK